MEQCELLQFDAPQINEKVTGLKEICTLNILLCCRDKIESLKGSNLLLTSQNKALNKKIKDAEKFKKSYFILKKENEKFKKEIKEFIFKNQKSNRSNSRKISVKESIKSRSQSKKSYNGKSIKSYLTVSKNCSSEQILLNAIDSILIKLESQSYIFYLY